MFSREKLPCLVLLLIGIAGVGISIYLTTVHYAGAPLVCASNGLINCERVLTSGYSSVIGIPLSVGGIGWFAVTGTLGLLGVVREPEPPLLQPLQIAWSLLGLATVLYLVGVEVIALGVVCAWCTTLHVLIVAALLTSLLRTPPDPASETDSRTRSGATPARRGPGIRR